MCKQAHFICILGQGRSQCLTLDTAMHGTELLTLIHIWEVGPHLNIFLFNLLVIDCSWCSCCFQVPFLCCLGSWIHIHNVDIGFYIHGHMQIHRDRVKRYWKMLCIQRDSPDWFPTRHFAFLFLFLLFFFNYFLCL